MNSVFGADTAQEAHLDFTRVGACPFCAELNFNRRCIKRHDGLNQGVFDAPIDHGQFLHFWLPRNEEQAVPHKCVRDGDFADLLRLICAVMDRQAQRKVCADFCILDIASSELHQASIRNRMNNRIVSRIRSREEHAADHD